MAGGVVAAAPRPRLSKLSVEGKEFATTAEHYNGMLVLTCLPFCMNFHDVQFAN